MYYTQDTVNTVDKPYTGKKLDPFGFVESHNLVTKKVQNLKDGDCFIWKGMILMQTVNEDYVNLLTGYTHSWEDGPDDGGSVYTFRLRRAEL